MDSLAVFFLAAVAVGGVAWVFVYPILSGERKAEKRMASVAKTEAGRRARRAGRRNPAATVVESTLKEFEERQQEDQARRRSRCASRRPA